jgi:hypothetical protein
MSWIDKAQRYANPGSLTRGKTYARNGKILELSCDEGRVSSVALGSRGERYQVRLSESFFDCSCPYGQSGEFCKHIVATAYLADEEIRPKEDKDKRNARSPLWSTAVQLQERVEELANDRGRGFDWDKAGRYGDAVYAAAALIEDAGNVSPSERLGIVQRLLTLACRVIMRSDDSSGFIGDSILRAAGLHRSIAQDCAEHATMTAQEQLKLAKFIYWFNLENNANFWWMHLYDYTAALGREGTAAFIRMAVSYFSGEDSSYKSRDFKEDLAICKKDKQAIVKVFGGALNSYGDFRKVVDALERARLRADAAKYARRGFEETFRGGLHFPETDFDYLTEYLVQIAGEDLHKTLAIRQSAYERFVTAKRFKTLRKVARICRTWPALQPEAEALLETQSSEYAALLYEDERFEELWRLFLGAEKKATRFVSRQQILKARTVTHPEETIPYYEQAVRESAKETSQKGYREQCRWLKLLRRAWLLAMDKGAVKDTDGFETFVAEMLEFNKRRPTCLDEYYTQGIVAP